MPSGNGFATSYAPTNSLAQALAHPWGILAHVDGGWVEGGELAAHDQPVRLTFKDDHRCEDVTGGHDGEGCWCPLHLT